MPQLIDLAMHFHWETEKAIFVSENGKKEDAVWLPKSHTEMEVSNVGGNPSVIVTLPEWLAKEKKLI